MIEGRRGSSYPPTLFSGGTRMKYQCGSSGGIFLAGRLWHWKQFSTSFVLFCIYVNIKRSEVLSRVNLRRLEDLLVQAAFLALSLHGLCCEVHTQPFYILRNTALMSRWFRVAFVCMVKRKIRNAPSVPSFMIILVSVTAETKARLLFCYVHKYLCTSLARYFSCFWSLAKHITLPTDIFPSTR